MQALLWLSQGIDRISGWVGKLSMWLILITTLISAGNAIMRKLFDISNNAMLEIQWYLFAAVFLLGSGYCLMKNAHVRIDFLSSKLGAKARNWIDIFGIVLILFPLCIICIDLSWPFFMMAYNSGEMSANAGGLIRWPVYLCIPVGFGLLAMQGVSELIKRIAFLRGQGPDSLAFDEGEEEAKQLAKLVAAQLDGDERSPSASQATPVKAS
jgi:TRAP-type mannitol/chloroaromatic compound transport system permease small subunit